jgi:hypothetical protein
MAIRQPRHFAAPQVVYREAHAPGGGQRDAHAALFATPRVGRHEDRNAPVPSGNRAIVRFSACGPNVSESATVKSAFESRRCSPPPESDHDACKAPVNVVS